MNICQICSKKLRIDNTINFCRQHRNHSPILKEQMRQYSKSIKSVVAEKWKNRSEEERKIAKEKNRIACQKYRKNNKEKRKQSVYNWNKNNPKKVKQILKKSRDKRRSTLKGNIDHRMQNGIRLSLKGNKLGRNWEKLVGYTLDELILSLISKLPPGMKIEDLLTSNVHIDHIKPKSSFLYTSVNDEQFKKCWALDNLQPLWAKDNLTKSNKY